MRAVVYHGKNDLRVEDVPVPVPEAGELLLEVHAVGVCGTDAAEWAHGPSIYAFPGPHPVTGHSGPLIPGHELSGRVVARGDGVNGFGLLCLIWSNSSGESLPCLVRSASGMPIWPMSCSRPAWNATS